MTRLFGIITFLVFAAVGIKGDVLTVGPGESYTSISLAIKAANSGDTIRVLTGNYVENLTLDKQLVIEGVGSPIISGTGSGSVVTVTAPDCHIRGLVIQRSGSDLQAEDAGILLKSERSVVEDNELRDVLFGIYLYHSSENIVRRNTIVGRIELESGERGAGLHLWNSPNNRLEENVISYARDGMYIQSSPNNTIRGNRVSNLRYGLHFMNSNDNTFEDNAFFDNVAGAAIMYSERIQLRRNAFIHNRGFSSFGVLFQDCRDCVTEENLIMNNATGIFLEATQNSTFTKNMIAENDVALQIFSSSSKNVFTANNFIDNLSPLSLVGRGGSVDWQTMDGGNYWSDYGGYDLDSDTFGDVPHKIQNIFEYLEGSFPRLRIYLNSPAAQSMVIAERSFPILKGSQESDRKPLMRPVKATFTATQFIPRRGRSWALPAACFMMLAFSIATFKWGFSR